MAHDILVVDDEKDIRDLISAILEDEGYDTRTAADGFTALSAIKHRQPSLVILDVWLGDSDRDGLNILEMIKRDHPFVPVIMISGHGTIETAVSAIKKGAYDFIEKPFQVERLLVLIERAIEAALLKRENTQLKKQNAGTLIFKTQLSKITQFKQNLEKLAPMNSRIFIKGPPGSEKDIIARFLHENSKRHKNPLITLNCRTLHPQFIEAELFGVDLVDPAHEEPRKIGLIEQAHSGTLFIDHIEDMPLPIQAKFLRFLQESKFQRVGGVDKIPVDVRILSGSSAVEHAMEHGNFREDLYYRLATESVVIPALKERVLDIPLLAQTLVDEHAIHNGLAKRTFSNEALTFLQGYVWPGNLRQLKNMVEWILIQGNTSGHDREPIALKDLPRDIMDNSDTSSTWNKHAEIAVLPLREARELFERDYLMAQVNRFSGNISRTARFIGMERSALHRKLRALGMGEEKKDETSESTESSSEVA